MLKVEGLTAAYGELTALRDISISVEEHESVAIVGGNGAGKTTLLRVISGLMGAKSGTVNFRGARIDILSPREICLKGLAHVPEGRRLFPLMTVRENLEMGAYLLPARRHLSQSLNNVYGLFPRLRERQNQKAGSLSGGEQQMLALGRGLMSQPKLLLLDEPTQGVAPLVISEMFGALKNLQQRGMTILLVSQEVRRSLELCHRAYVLENGEIVMENHSQALLSDAKIRTAYLGV